MCDANSFVIDSQTVYATDSSEEVPQVPCVYTQRMVAKVTQSNEWRRKSYKQTKQRLLTSYTHW